MSPTDDPPTMDPLRHGHPRCLEVVLCGIVAAITAYRRGAMWTQDGSTPWPDPWPHPRPGAASSEPWRLSLAASPRMGPWTPRRSAATSHARTTPGSAARAASAASTATVIPAAWPQGRARARPPARPACSPIRSAAVSLPRPPPPRQRRRQRPRLQQRHQPRQQHLPRPRRRRPPRRPWRRRPPQRPRPRHPSSPAAISLAYQGRTIA